MPTRPPVLLPADAIDGPLSPAAAPAPGSAVAPAPAAASVPAASSPRRSWRGALDVLRGRRSAPDETELARQRVQRYEEAAALLEQARDVVEHGWVQGTWYLLAAKPGRRTLPAPAPAVAGRDDVVAACLVGAVLHAAKRTDPRADMGTWGLPLDLVWDAVHGHAGDDPGALAGRGWRAAPAYVRASRAREVARWNDRPGRELGEVLGVLDVAVAGAIQGAVRAAPAPPPAGRTAPRS